MARVKASAIKLLAVALIDYVGNGAPYCRSNNGSSLKVRLTATMSENYCDCFTAKQKQSQTETKKRKWAWRPPGARFIIWVSAAASCRRYLDYPRLNNRHRRPVCGSHYHPDLKRVSCRRNGNALPAACSCVVAASPGVWWLINSLCVCHGKLCSALVRM